MAKYRIAFVICLLVFLEACYSYRYEQLTYYKKYVDKGEIRFDGFYFCEDSVAANGVVIKPWSWVFYSDGTYTEAEGDLRNPKRSETFLKNSGFTGPFIIDKDTIRCQSFYNTSESIYTGTMAVWEVGIHIVNDELLEQVRRDGSDKKWTYRFIPFDHKPDSSKAWFKSRKKLRKLFND
jgi:hypothetical protein